MGGKMSEMDFATSIIAGALQAGMLGMTGDGADPSMWTSGLQAVSANKGKGIAIIKPRGQKELMTHIGEAEKSGALAVGIDIDGAGLITMALKGQPVSPKSIAELKEVISSTKLPFILKGVMTPEEAELAVEAGAAAIVVSNHGGRVLDFTPGTADVLPMIAERVNGEILIFADGGVRSGADVLKLLALGADAALVGRPLVVGAFGGGAEGVALLLKKIKDELVSAMLLTGSARASKVDRAILAS
jgi:isopentenyl diphosphate isomerase/L-lactate dehydrogenase-like FMN-dependent dehydrogenase